MDWSKCPYCDSENIEAGEYDDGGLNIAFRVVCNDCLKAWFEVYDQSHREDFNGEEL